MSIFWLKLQVDFFEYLHANWNAKVTWDYLFIRRLTRASFSPLAWEAGHIPLSFRLIWRRAGQFPSAEWRVSDTCCCYCWSAVRLHSDSQEQEANPLPTHTHTHPSPPALLHLTWRSRLFSSRSSLCWLFLCYTSLLVPPYAFLCRLVGPTVTGILITPLSSATLPPHLTVALRSHCSFISLHATTCRCCCSLHSPFRASTFVVVWSIWQTSLYVAYPKKYKTLF